MGRGLGAHRYPIILLGCYLARRLGSRLTKTERWARTDRVFYELRLDTLLRSSPYSTQEPATHDLVRNTAIE
jgi:hypothetical protein